MLTRLKIAGFKNLVDVDIRFGPFTCIAGSNAVGKSNLFDAIRFLSNLANDTLLNAALAVRAEQGRTGDIRTLFHRVGNHYADRMSFEAEMIIPSEGVDDLGQQAAATITFVRYRLEIGYRVDTRLPTLGGLEILREDLEHIKLSDAPKFLKFPHNAGAWRRSVLKGRRTSSFISTHDEGDNRIITLSQDGVQGRPKSLLAVNLPRTVLSTVNATESPTALLTRRELQSWQMLQLEPAALRESDPFTTPPGLGSDGSHLPATLYYLARADAAESTHESTAEDYPLFNRVATRLSEFIDDIYAINIDRDQQRELLTLQIMGRDGTIYPARSLSDGTLRFLALAVLNFDAQTGGLLCLEEPENGIHPGRIPAMLRLLQDIACDVTIPIGPDNPLRQVIINTHSPAVVSQIPDDSLLVAESREMAKNGRRFQAARFSWLPDTWRNEAEPSVSPVGKGKLLAYLNPVVMSQSKDSSNKELQPYPPRRVIDRSDLQLTLPYLQE
ncbi:MAG: AAA family ATPase [Caldilineaceae bacterium]